MGLAEDLRDAGTIGTSSDRLGQLCLHADRRVRVLCAKNPNLSQKSAETLADDSEGAVRAAVAWSRQLDSDRCERLLRDPVRRVRRATLRSQNLGAEFLQHLIESGMTAPALFERLKAHLADEAVTERLMSNARWSYFAAQGRFTHESIRKLLDDNRRAGVLALIASVGVISHRSVHLLARKGTRQTQEASAGRADLSKGTALWMALTGGRWAVASLLHRESTSRLTRLFSLRRVHRVVRRARAETSRSKLGLMVLARSAWDVRVAVAANPATRPRTLRRLRSSGSWAVDETLARRTDLPSSIYHGMMYHKPFNHPAVDLRLAANTAVPEEKIRVLLASEDRFVSEMALTHPQAPIELVAAAAASSATPAWVLRRLATSQRLPPGERDRILVWLTLGGGLGDPSFDPIGCIGSPGAPGVPLDEAYREQTRRNGLSSSLWRSRALVGRGAGKLDLKVIAHLARDSHPEVRHVAAGYRAIGTLDELRYDRMPRVSVQADTIWRQTATPKKIVSRVPRWAYALGPIIMVGAVSASHQSSSSPTDLILKPAPIVIPTARWVDGVQRPDIPPLCSWSGGTIWVKSGVLTDVYISADGDNDIRVSSLVTMNFGQTSPNRIDDIVLPRTVSMFEVDPGFSPGSALIDATEVSSQSTRALTVYVPFGEALSTGAGPFVEEGC